MKFHYDYFKRLYDKNYEATTWLPNDFFRKIRMKKIASHIRPNSKVLDYGGGDGYLANFLVKCDYFTSDLSSKHDLQDKQKLGIIDDVYIDMADSSYDVIVISEVIEHLPNCYEVLMELTRLLRINGRLIITTPNPYGLFYILRSFFGLHQDKSKEHLQWFDWSYLSNLCTACGLHLQSKSTYNVLYGRFYPRIYFLETVLNKVLPYNGHQLFCVFCKNSNK